MKMFLRTIKYVFNSYKTLDGQISIVCLLAMLLGLTGANPYRENLQQHPLLFLIPVAIALAGSLHRALNERDELQVKRLAFGTVESNEWGEHFRIEVKCTGGKTVDECGVTMIDSIPRIDHLPIPMHWTHEPRPGPDKIAMNPDSTRKIDVIRFTYDPRAAKTFGPPQNKPRVLRFASASMDDQYEVINPQNYMFKLHLHGRDTVSTALWVEFANVDSKWFLKARPDFIPPYSPPVA